MVEMFQLQSGSLDTASMCVVRLDKVVIFAERCVFTGFLQFSKPKTRTSQNRTYESIAVNVSFFQVIFISRLACPIR
jgi:hypothetical protein